MLCISRRKIAAIICKYLLILESNLIRLPQSLLPQKAIKVLGISDKMSIKTFEDPLLKLELGRN
jgi:hypothetical protein